MSIRRLGQGIINRDAGTLRAMLAGLPAPVDAIDVADLIDTSYGLQKSATNKIQIDEDWTNPVWKGLHSFLRDNATDEISIIRLGKRDEAGSNAKRWDFLIDDNTGILRLKPLDSNVNFNITSLGDTLRVAMNTTSGDVSLAGGLYVGDATGDPASGDIMTTADIRVTGGMHIGAVDTDPSVGVVTIETNTSLTNANTRGLILQHNTSGTPAAGFGNQIHFQLESTTTEDRDAATIAAEWATATDASRKGMLKFYSRDASTLREVIAISTSGSAGLLGFFGSTPVVQQDTSLPTNNQPYGTADTNYGAGEAGIINNVSYDLTNLWTWVGYIDTALRNYGLLT